MVKNNPFKNMTWEVVENPDYEEPPWRSSYKKDCPPSRAFVASDGGERIIVLDYIGPDLEMWAEEVGNDFFECYDSPGVGLWIWEGTVVKEKYLDGECDINLEGDFRQLNDEEWDLLQEDPQSSPWFQDDWVEEQDDDMEDLSDNEKDAVHELVHANGWERSAAIEEVKKNRN